VEGSHQLAVASGQPASCLCLGPPIVFENNPILNRSPVVGRPRAPRPRRYQERRAALVHAFLTHWPRVQILTVRRLDPS